jgi:hypothetical protein
MQRLADIGCAPYAGDSFALPYSAKGRSFCNLVGCIAGSDRTQPPLLIAAHYDSYIAAPSADDNASAIAITLQAAKSLRKSGALRRDLIVAIFDAEEPPYFSTSCMGSNRFYEDHVHDRRQIHAALVMDLVGHDVLFPADMLRPHPRQIEVLDSLRSLLFVTGSESHPELAEVLRASGQPADLRVIPTQNSYIGDMSDHGAFRRHGVPYLFLSCGMWEHYHMPSDTPDRLSYPKMAAITRYVLRLIQDVDRCGLADRDTCERVHDTVTLESAFIRQALVPVYDAGMSTPVLDGVTDRDGITRFVEHVLFRLR